ncbi:ANTAR domain-containing protein [Streptomyces sp. NPDC126514]|uniref:ANTAR domain-containing protein n=1 Tax=Streptomyces sp. NPDC126514 TaxID=3155210 RepID=UPI00332CA1FE
MRSLPHREPTAAERDKLIGDAQGLAEELGIQLVEGLGTSRWGEESMLADPSTPLAYLEALGELAGAVECLADNAASDARCDGANYEELAQAWGTSYAEAKRKWGTPVASVSPFDPDSLAAETWRLVQVLANVAIIVGQQRALERGRVERDQLQNELSSHIVMEQAMGILAERWHVSVDEALVAFDASTHDDGRELAREIVDGTARGGSITQRLPESDLTGRGFNAPP